MYRDLAVRIAVFLLIFGLSATAFAGTADDQYAIAARHYSNARWQLAIDEFEAFLAGFADDERASAVLFFLAESHVQLEQYPKAARRFDDYLTKSPTGKYACKALFRLGETAYLGGDHDRAVEVLQRFRAKYPTDELNAYLLPYLGEISLNKEQPKLAEGFFSQALKDFPDGAMANECRFGLARAMEETGDNAAAIRFYRFLAETEKRGPLCDDALLQLGILLYRDGQYKESVETLARFHEQFPGNELASHAWFWLGTAQFAMGDWNSSARSFKEGIAHSPNHILAPAMYFSCGETYRQAGKLREASAQYQKVVDQWPKGRWADDSFHRLVQAAWQSKDLPRTESLAVEFEKRFPDSPYRWLVRQTAGRSHLKLSHFEAAVTVFESLTHEGETRTTNEKPDVVGSEKENATVAARFEEAALENAIRAKSDPVNHYYLALAYLGLDRFQKSLDVLDSIPTDESNTELSEGVLVARASALMGLKQHALAVLPLRKYLESSQDGAEAGKCRAQLVVALAKMKQWSSVMETFGELRRLNSGASLYLPTVQFLAEAAYDDQQEAEAEQLFEELAKDKNPGEYRIQGLSGLAWLQWEHQDDAGRSAETFKKLLTEYPESPLAAEAALMRGRSLEKLARPEAALSMYQLVVEDYPDSKYYSNAVLAAARIHDQLGQDQDAESLLRTLLESAADESYLDSTLYQLAWVLVDLGRCEEADQLFERIRTEPPDSQYWADATYRIAERAVQTRQLERADQLAKAIVDRSDDSRMVSHSHYLRGQLAATQDRWDDVVRVMNIVTERFPDSALRLPAEYWLAEAFYRLHDFNTAEQKFDRLLREVGDRTDSWVAMIPLRRAQVAAHQGRWDDAFELAEPIRSRFPDFRQQYEVDYLLGRCHARRADFELARQSYTAVVDSPNGSKSETAAMAQWMIGETFFLQKKFDAAIRAYYRVEGLYDYPRWRAAALLQAGKCEEMKGNLDEATRLYSEVLEEHSTTTFAAKAATRLRLAQQRADHAEIR